MKRLNALLRKMKGNGFNQRWGVNATMTLKNSDGDVYLFRRRLIQTPWIALYLHDIEREDELPALHSHPFPFVSWIIRGGYTERTASPISATEQGPIEKKQHGRWALNVFPRGIKRVHCIDFAEPNTKTLVLAGKRRDSWGWFVDGEGLVHWSEYLMRDHTHRAYREVQ